MLDTRRSVLVLILGLIAIFIQGTVLREIAPAFVVPNILLIVVVFLGFFEASLRGATLTFLLGLELDFANGLLVGPWAGAFIVSFGILASLSQRIFVESPLAAVVAAFGSSLVSSLVYFTLVYEFHPRVTVMVPFSILEAGMNAALAPIVFVFLRTVLFPRSRGGVSGRLRATSV
ncbi:MAG: hypothetical protein RL417_1092 [Pseudomonadota bacterium]|jgi:rod shape-determining protein MreD